MSYYENVETITQEAGADLSTHQYKFVKRSAGQIVLCDTLGEDSIGVLWDNEGSAAGRATKVAIAGIVKVECGGAVTQNSPVATDATGRAVNGATGNRGLGTALEAGAAGEVIPVLLFIPHETLA